MKKSAITTILKTGQGMSGRLYWQKRESDYLLSSGHWLIVIQHQLLPIELAFIKDMPQGKMEGGRIEVTQESFDMNKVIPKDEELTAVLDKSRHLIELEKGKDCARVFLGDAFNTTIDERYVDFLNSTQEHSSNFTYKAIDERSPVVFYLGEQMVGLVMPIRVDERLLAPFTTPAKALKEVA